MSESVELALRQATEELESLYNGSAEGILIVDVDTKHIVRANRAICDLLGYSKEELLSLSVSDIHPVESLPLVLETFDTMRNRGARWARNILCQRKDGGVLHVDIAASYLDRQPHAWIVGFFRDITQQNRIIGLLRASEERYRLITDNVADIIWTVDFTLSDAERAAAKEDVAGAVDAILDRWRFSFVNPAGTRLFGYTPAETGRLSLHDITTPISHARIREAMIEEFAHKAHATEDGYQQHMLEAEFITKDGSLIWCEVASTYLRDDNGVPTSILGITRDISGRRKAEQALRASESKLRSLFENLPDVVVTVDRNAIVQFTNRVLADDNQKSAVGKCGLDFVAPEARDACCYALQQAFATGMPQIVEGLDIFGHWWSSRVVLLAQEGNVDQAMVICTDITHERLATEAVEKERRLLRHLLELHERERRLIAYEIHDGFAQQLAGALFRLQGFREAHSRNPGDAWHTYDLAVQLVSHAIDETRRLISGLRPPILDESGIIQAVAYLVCEQQGRGGPRIEFVHDVTFDRLAPPLETAIFRIVQESLQNACRHSHSDRIRVELAQQDSRINIEVRDWGVGFSAEAVAEQRFGLQGIRERVRLLDGHVVIESSPGKGTHVSVELPLIDIARRQTEDFDQNVVDAER